MACCANDVTERILCECQCCLQLVVINQRRKSQGDNRVVWVVYAWGCEARLAHTRLLKGSSKFNDPIGQLAARASDSAQQQAATGEKASWSDDPTGLVSTWLFRASLDPQLVML